MLTEQNTRLVTHMAKKYQYTDCDNEDSLSVGIIGLIKMVNMFNVDGDSRLTTCIARCMGNKILMLLRTHKKYSREVSLFEPIGIDKDGETASLVDMVEMGNKEILGSLVVRQDIKELYKAFEVCLRDNEETVIGMRYGLFDGEEYAQREIADMLGISRSYVSRIERKAVGRLRTKSEWHR